MGYIAKLKVFGREWEVQNAEVVYHRFMNPKTGRAGEQPMGGFIYLTLLSGYGDEVLVWWMLHSEEGELCKLTGGELSFYKDSFDTPVQFAYSFNDAALVQYKEAFSNQGETPMTIDLVISPAIQQFRGQTYIKHWQENWVKPIEQLPYQAKEESVEPEIVQVDWVDEDKKSITEILYTKKASIQAQLKNTKGGDVKVTITKKDGSEFEKNKKEFIFSKTATDGLVEFPVFEIKEVWLDFKNKDIDELIARVEYNEVHKKSNYLEIIPPPEVVVDFRPNKDYDGEYGFDYMRDKSEKKDLLTYKDILGANKKVSGSNVFTKYATDTKYTDLKDNQYTTITLPWYKDKKGKEIEYLQSWLAIYPGQKVTLSLQLETIANPKKQDLTLEYDTNLFKINTDTIPAQSKGKKRLKDHVEIECLKEFATDQTIKVMYQKRQLGQLMVLKNDKANRYKADVVFVKIKTDLSGKGKWKEGKIVGEKALLERYLKQGLITPKVVEETMDLTADITFNTKFAGKKKGYIDNKTGIHAYLNKKVDAKYKDYLKVYFIPDKCPTFDKNGIESGKVNGQAMAISSDTVVVFGGHDKATVSHEALHALGLYHTFSSHKKNAYSYKKGATYNIMDYSHWQKYGSKKRILTWLWQWKKLWSNALVFKE